jgi:hypothetical protein
MSQPTSRNLKPLRVDGLHFSPQRFIMLGCLHPVIGLFLRNLSPNRSPYPQSEAAFPALSPEKKNGA